jgi:hypothetical protein
VRVLCIGLVVVACGGEDGDPSSPSVAGTGGGASEGGVLASQLPYQPCSAETAVGDFRIELGDGFTSVEGKVFDGVTPSLVPRELVSEGECRLVTLPNLLCDPGCPVSTQTCGDNNQCLPLPVAHDVGTVTVTGLSRAVEMTPNAATGNYRPGPPALPYPGFAAGADLRVSASGGDYEAFELRGWGIEPLEFATDPISVTEGQPATVTWSAPADPGPARVHVQLNVNNHGSSNTWIECDFDDTGTGTISASLIDGLIAQGISGFPTITLTRRTATSTNISPGCVQLLVTSRTDPGAAIDVALTGLISCDDDSSVCPEGQSCKPIERFCE